MKTCKTCGKDLKYVAGGISKKGNRYEAFWGCKDKDCKYSEAPTTEEVKKYDLEARMNKMEEEQIRFKEMSMLNAQTAASNIARNLSEVREVRDRLHEDNMEWFVKSVVREED